MEEYLIAVTILWSFLFVYSMLGSLDFGAGFWALVYGKKKHTNASSIANRFLSPTWEVTNVFLVLFVVTLVSFFPFATSMLGTLLLIPVGLGLILLTIRTTFMMFSHYANKFQDLLRITSGITGLLIPALLVSILPITLGGFVVIEDGYPQLLYGKLLTSPTTYMHIAFGISTELFLSALFLTDYAREANDHSAFGTYRKQAIWLGPLTLLIAVLTIFTMPAEASWLVENVQDNLYGFGMSIALFAIGYSLLFFKQKNGKLGYTRAAVTFVILQYGFAIYAYGSAHLPYMVYPHLTIEAGFTNTNMFYQLLIGYIVGLSILVPAFILFWRLFLKDQRYLEQK
ncbi:cytochrome d ubiquinol oxidase subunit II [Pontibacillus yanchengensis]|uniref:Membrane protein n=1 Tax=Pontibacillus yanchengensis Y32 TaxID=1385514 RepID=A0A0A2TX41_9BACI|nr:cytochrome d ubiquinol oxidase subunit II [Pontibacillus yanchengensis]KGP73810.1 membrane protein [Pontibacillus yanchengensis Y32]